MRGLSTKWRARLIIDNCAHPDDRPALAEYYQRALRVPAACSRRRCSTRRCPGTSVNGSMRA
ncbi:hypothetical protein ACFFTN_09965 [Aminobacter aganoensis]|uniref:hypothetical protein n=1 Tax=Aminobacter aganoensis TaxID=83264 RepID=UPI0035EC2846